MITKMRFLLVLLLVSGSAVAGPILTSHVDVSVGLPVWSYTVFNDEPADSPNFVTTFNLAVNAPIVVTGTPTGWDFLTDGSSFVFWFNADPSFPYPNDIAPAGSLGGFAVTSDAAGSSELLRYDLSAWDHTLDQPGPTVSGTVLAPSTSAPTSTPEPGTLWLLSAGGCLMLLGRSFGLRLSALNRAAGIHHR